MTNLKLKTLLIVVLGALVLLLAAYINGFPIVYSDTATYLASGFELATPFDRPITYGLFLRVTSLNGASLWLTIFSQALIVSSLIFKLLRIVVPQQLSPYLSFLFIIACLSLLTGVSWTTSQLIADIFTPIILLSILVLALDQSKEKTKSWFYFIFLLATAMHTSHIAFNLLLILSIITIRQLNVLGIRKVIKLKPLLICCCLSFLSILTMGSALSKSKHGFLMGALVEHGIVKKYLEENCHDVDYKFCAYKDSLPDKAWKFLWNKNSPFYKMGGWRGTKDEFNEIIYQTLVTPKYLVLHIVASLKATGDQLSKFQIGDGNGSFLEGTLLHKRVASYFKQEVHSYESSLQNSKKLTFLSWYNNILLGVVLFSLVGLLLVLIQALRLDKNVVSMILIVIIGIAVNAWACGTLANAIDRLGSKMIWLIPLTFLIGSINSWNIIPLPQK